uniref:DUF229 domain containing protein n=1 Tax=Syphacia muris TaxID=451379 RepID=A0A0N5AI23_9BILA
MIHGTARGESCFYRCLYQISDKSYNLTGWSSITVNQSIAVNCDFPEVFCNSTKEKVTWRYLHTQRLSPETLFGNKSKVRTIPNKVFQAEDQFHPSVFMIVIDSTSASSGARTLPKSIQVLNRRYEAQEFLFHNKVGLNSRPNAHGIFLGERITNLPADPIYFPNNTHLSEVPNSCKVPLNSNHSILEKFTKEGYVTMAFEDDTSYSFLWPNCKGYSKLPTDHWSTPYVLHYRKLRADFSRFMFGPECQQLHSKIFDYCSQFFKKYQGFAKFSYIWLDNAHNTPNALFYVDEELSQFLIKNYDYLRNSFVFMIGDHGLRFGGIRMTAAGAHEDKNPMFIVACCFYMAVPESLRKNDQLMSNIRKNSRRHTSHFDLYATLNDIVQVAKTYDFYDWRHHDFRPELGEIRGGVRAMSLLRLIPYDRFGLLVSKNCMEMSIHYLYCICEEQWEKVKIDSKILKGANAAVEFVHSHLAKQNVSELCQVLSVAKVTRALKMTGSDRVKITFNTSPNNAEFESVLNIDGNGELVATALPNRLDAYGHQGDCAIAEDTRPFCCCLKQTKT